MDKIALRNEIEEVIKAVENILDTVTSASENYQLPECVIERLRCYARIVETQKDYLSKVEVQIDKDNKYEIGRLCNLIWNLSTMVQTDVLWLRSELDTLPINPIK